MNTLEWIIPFHYEISPLILLCIFVGIVGAIEPYTSAMRIEINVMLYFLRGWDNGW